MDCALVLLRRLLVEVVVECDKRLLLMIQINHLQVVVGYVVVIVIGDRQIARCIGQSVEASHAIVEMDDDVLAGTILLAVQEFRHFFGTLREAITKTIGVALLRLDVKLILAFEVLKVTNGELGEGKNENE